MSKIVLVEPKKEYEEGILVLRDEILNTDGIIHGDGGLSTVCSLNDWFRYLCMMKSDIVKEMGLVPSTTYICIIEDTNQVIGIVNIRHELNETLYRRGGNIGCSIIPSFRNRGYGVAMLKLALDKCKEMKMDKVLLTCANYNVASQKTIMACKGVYEETKESIQDSFKRYWIKL